MDAHTHKHTHTSPPASPACLTSSSPSVHSLPSCCRVIEASTAQQERLQAIAVSGSRPSLPSLMHWTMTPAFGSVPGEQRPRWAKAAIPSQHRCCAVFTQRWLHVITCTSALGAQSCWKRGVSSPLEMQLGAKCKSPWFAFMDSREVWDRKNQHPLKGLDWGGHLGRSGNQAAGSTEVYAFLSGTM